VIGQFLSQAAGVAALVAAVASGLYQWRKTRAENHKTGAEAYRTDAEGQVALSGDYRAWAERADKRAEKAETDAAEARAAAREANDRADQARRDRDNDRELIEDLRRDHNALRGSYEALIERIGRCKAGPFCPIASSVGSP
jgi:hypothetical protein